MGRDKSSGGISTIVRVIVLRDHGHKMAADTMALLSCAYYGT
jgi:hypothetical protein